MENKTAEDWFLRGGEKPAKSKKDAVELAVCQNCGGMNLAGETDKCTHCGASLAGGCPTDEYCGADGETPAAKKFKVVFARVKSVEQTCSVEIEAGSEEEAMSIAQQMADDIDLSSKEWKSDEDTVEYDDPWPYEVVS